LLTSSVVLIHDNARLHTAACAQALLEHFNWELFDHPSYSPDLVVIDCHLITYLKAWFGSRRVTNNEELMEGVKMWLSPQAADFFGTGIQRLFTRNIQHH
jgi:transposase